METPGEEQVLQELVEMTERQVYDWYIKNTSKAGLTSIISYKTTPPNLRNIAQKIKDILDNAISGINRQELDAEWNNFYKEIDELAARKSLPPPEGIVLKIEPQSVDIEGVAQSMEKLLSEEKQLYSQIDSDFKSIIDNAYNNTYKSHQVEVKEIEFEEAPTIDFTRSEGLVEDFKPMEVVSGEEGIIVRDWANYIKNGLGMENQALIYNRLESLGGETYIELSEQGRFIGQSIEEAEGVFTRVISRQVITVANFRRYGLIIGRSIAWGFVIGLGVWAAFRLLEEVTGIDWTPVLDGLMSPGSLQYKKQLENISSDIGETRFGNVSLNNKLVQVRPLVTHIERLEELRKMVNRVYNCYYQIVEKTNYQASVEEISFKNYLQNHKSKLLWVVDSKLIKRFDDFLVTPTKRYSGRTDFPTKLNNRWTQKNRADWETEVLRNIHTLIQSDNLKVCEELKKRKELNDNKDKQLVETLLFETALPYNLIFWSLIWSSKAYSDPFTKFSGQLLKGYAPFGEFDFDAKPIDNTFDFITETIEDSRIPILNLWLSATLAYSPHQNVLFVASRGTDFDQINRLNPAGMINFLHNALIDIALTKTDYEGIMEHHFSVHSGFLTAFLNLKDRLLTRIRVLVDRYNPREVIFTGHSLGSAISKVCMIDKDISQYATAYIGFGSPRVTAGVGDKEIYRKRWGNRSIRINNADDLVSYLPLPIQGYHFMDKGLLIDRQTGKQRILDGDYRYKTAGEYLDKLAGMEGHNRVKYLESCCNLVIPRPVNIPEFIGEFSIIDPGHPQSIYLKSCAYKAFISLTKLNSAKVVLNLLRFFSQFQKLDLDTDGNISRQEYTHIFRGRRLAKTLGIELPDFDLMDLDGNGLISFKEFLGYSMRQITGDLNIVPIVPSKIPTVVDIEDLGNILRLVILPERKSENLVEYLTII
jgi:hypothetical protein